MPQNKNLLNNVWRRERELRHWQAAILEAVNVQSTEISRTKLGISAGHRYKEKVQNTD